MNTELTQEEERLALEYDPFDGDIDVDVITFSDKFVNGRKEHDCFYCCDKIEPGERHRARTERDNEDRKVKTFRFCNACCKAFAIEVDEGDDEPSLERYRLGEAKRRAA